MGIQIEREKQKVTFAFVNPPDESGLTTALSTLLEVLHTVSPNREVFATWDEEKSKWRVEEASDEIMKIRARMHSRRYIDPDVAERIRKAFGSRPDLPPGDEYVRQVRSLWAGLIGRHKDD